MWPESPSTHQPFGGRRKPQCPRTVSAGLRAIPLAAVLWALLIATVVHAAEFDAKVTWADKSPTLHAELRRDSVPEKLTLRVTLFDAQDERLSRHTLELTPAESQSDTLTGALALEKVNDPRKQHRLQLRLDAPEHELHVEQQLHFLGPKSKVRSFGIKTLGVYPERRVVFSLALAHLDDRIARDVPVGLSIRDRDDTALVNQQLAVVPEDEPTQHEFLLTRPELKGAVGPFNVAINLESEAHELYFAHSTRFAHPSAVVPVSSMETGKPKLWFATEGHNPAGRGYRTGGYYYSNQLRTLTHVEDPALDFDPEVKRSGTRSLRIGYRQGVGGAVWSRHTLPGRSLAMRLWVKGNGS